MHKSDHFFAGDRYSMQRCDLSEHYLQLFIQGLGRLSFQNLLFCFIGFNVLLLNKTLFLVVYHVFW